MSTKFGGINLKGSMVKTKSGSYRFFASGGSDGSGQRIRFTKTVKVSPAFKTEKARDDEAERLLALFVTECENKDINELENVKLKEFAEYWLEKHVKQNLAPKTILSYTAELNHRIIPALGNIKMKDLKPLHLIDFYNALNDAPRLDKRPGKLSGRAKQNIHRILSSMLTDAVKWQVIKDNPATKVEAPKNSRKQAKYYDESQSKLLLSALDKLDDKWRNIKWKTVTYIALFTGMRIGEIMGLEWSDIDFTNGILKIQRASQYANKQRITKSPKNETSIRTIAINQTLINILNEYKEYWDKQKNKCEDKWNDTNRLFVQWNGLPMFPGSYGKWLPKFLTDNKLPKINPHGLRHTSATILINQGLNIKAVSARLGHADTTTTLNIYTHVLKSADREAAERLENLLIKDSEEKVVTIDQAIKTKKSKKKAI